MTANTKPKEDATLEELFIQLKEEFVSHKKVNEKTVRARLLQHVKRGQESETDKFIYKQKAFVQVLVLNILAVVSVVASIGIRVYWNDLVGFVQSSMCLVENNSIVSEFTRPEFNCELCRNVTNIERIANISRLEFLDKYAYTTIPVVITGATKGWKAFNTFHYQYFKTLYTEVDGGLEDIDEECQFVNWGYQFGSMAEAFNMTDAQAKLEPGENKWYFGWSNCHPRTSVELRSNYNRLSFLPEDYESSQCNWIFMGWPGTGAFIHIDHVIRPSWQAQISGRKKWTFVPLPECGGICKDKYEVIVEKGDVIILDSNQWYHATLVMPGEISITIGSEYD